MGRGWDGGDLVFRPAIWHALAQHLLPGAFLMAFASSRGYHRLACALEDAGLIVHPAIGWVQASGWPKSTKIDSQLDAHGGQNLGWFGPWLRQWREEKGIPQKELAQYFPSRSGGLTGCVANWELGLNTPTAEQYRTLVEVLGLPFPSLEAAEREVIGTGRSGATALWSTDGGMGDYAITAPATPLAQAWAGHRYGLQALKPALEFIAVAQVPYAGRPVDSITQTGAGALWIDGGRIGMTEADQALLQAKAHKEARDSIPYSVYNYGLHRQEGSVPAKRWPPNLALCHTDCCQPLGPQQVRGNHGQGNGQGSASRPSAYGLGAQPVKHYVSPDGTEVVDAWSCDPACPIGRLDAQAGERTTHGQVSPYQTKANDVYGNLAGHVNQPRATDTGPASRFFPCFTWSLDVAEQLAQADPIRYCAKASQAERSNGLPGRNPHPTLKPLALCTWLATLLLPPAAYAPRRLLVPFAGTGSEMVGGIRAGFDVVLGIEQDQATVQTARQRLTYWTGASFPAEPVLEGAEAVASVSAPGQLSLF